MRKFNTSTVTFNFKFGKINNKVMTTTIQNGKEIYAVTPSSDLTNTTTISIILPTTIILNFSGKNYNTDTTVDADGNILNDMCVEIKSILIDKFPLNEIFIHQKLQIVADDGRQLTTAYIGVNGQITLHLSKTTVFSQYLTLNN